MKVFIRTTLEKLKPLTKLDDYYETNKKMVDKINELVDEVERLKGRKTTK